MQSPFLPPFFPPPEISSFWEFQFTSLSLGLKKYFRPLIRRKYLMGSSLLTSSISMILTFLLFSIASLAVAPPQTFPLLPPLSPFLAHERCFSTWVLITYQFFYLFLSLRSFAPTRVPLLLIFRKLAGMTLLFTLTLTVLLLRNTRLFLFSLLPLKSSFLSATSDAILKPGDQLK